MENTDNKAPSFDAPTPVGGTREPALKEHYVPDPKPKGRGAAPKKKPEPVNTKTGGQDLGRSYVITLHDSKEIPPGGQLVAVNGQQFRIPSGRKVIVPAAVLEVLDNALQSTPVLNDALQVVDYTHAPRLSYTLHRETA